MEWLVPGSRSAAAAAGRRSVFKNPDETTLYSIGTAKRMRAVAYARHLVRGYQ